MADLHALAARLRLLTDREAALATREARVRAWDKAVDPGLGATSSMPGIDPADLGELDATAQDQIADEANAIRTAQQQASSERHEIEKAAKKAGVTLEHLQDLNDGECGHA